MRRFDSCIFCAILRRRPTILTSCVASEVAAALGVDTGFVRAPPRATLASRSAWTMRPALPVAMTSRKSTPSSQARARTAGDAIGRCADDVDAGVGGRAGATTAGAAGATARVEVGVDADASGATGDACEATGAGADAGAGFALD